MPATNDGVIRIAITGWRSKISSPRCTALIRSQRSGPGAVTSARPAFSPIAQPAMPPPVAVTQATPTTVARSSLCFAARIPAASSTGSPGPGNPIQLAADAAARPR